jgi:hypothetical protein
MVFGWWSLAGGLWLVVFGWWSLAGGLGVVRRMRAHTGSAGRAGLLLFQHGQNEGYVSAQDKNEERDLTDLGRDRADAGESE